LKVYRRLIRYVRPYWLLFAASFAATGIGSVLDGFTMILLIPFLRSLFGAPAMITTAGSPIERFLDKTVGWFLDPTNASAALRNVVIIVMVGLTLKNAFYYASSYIGVKIRERIVRDLQDDLYGHIQALPLTFFDRNKAGQLLARVFSDTSQIKQIITVAISDVLKQSVTLVAFVAALVLISWKLTLIALFVAPLFLGFLKPMLWRLRHGFRAAFDVVGELTSMLQETASGARLVKAYGAEKYEHRRFIDTNKVAYRHVVRAERIALLSSPLSEVLGSIVTLVLVWVGAQFVFSGDMTAEAFLTFLTISLRLQSPIKALATLPARAQSSMAAADRFFDVIDSAKEPLLDGVRDLEGLNRKIVYENVHFAYDQEPVLKGVSFEVERGEVLAIVGPSGAGKSTIVDLLPRFYEPQGGCITVDGTDIRDVSLVSLRGLLGYVSQETIIFHDTVRANIAYGMVDRYSDEDIEAAARAANAHDFILRLPDGYDTILGDRGLRLSGGQRQRISIARAILRDPPVLILDEATSSLDTESERLVQAAIDRLLANRTVIVIAHRLSTIQHAHNIIVLDAGRIVESGRHKELLEKNGPYRRLYELQFGATDDGVARGGVAVH